MALQTVTLTWDLTDLIQAGVSATLTITPTAVLTDTADAVVVLQVPRQVTFTGGTGSLAGIVATDNASISPAGWAYQITVATTGTVIAPPVPLLAMTAKIPHAGGATQDLSALVPLQQATEFSAYLPLQYMPGAGEGLAWTSDGAGNGSWQVPSAPVVFLTDASVVSVPAALGADFRLTLTGSHELASPTGLTDGRKLLFQVTQGTGGGFTLTYGTAYEFSTALPAPTLSATAGKTDLLEFVYNAAKGKCLFTAFHPGF